MSYTADDQSVQSGAPVYKFRFVTGTTVYPYTSAAYFISDSNDTYEPAPIRATNITQSDELAKNGVQITLPRNNALALTFLGTTPDEATSLTIFRGHGDNFVTYWKGRVTSAKADGDAVILDCEDIFTSMVRPGLRARYQRSCRHALYSAECGIDAYTVTDIQEVYALDADTVSVWGPGGAALGRADGYYTGGSISINGGPLRRITDHTGETLTLQQAYPAMTVPSSGLTCEIQPGCAHTVDDCANKFSNIKNYGGFPYMPDSNPFRNSVGGSIV